MTIYLVKTEELFSCHWVSVFFYRQLLADIEQHAEIYSVWFNYFSISDSGMRSTLNYKQIK